tara:strand:+ start:3443 stop:4153 length:711 start_codon:yes stop_codon:yes gene_type:complete
MKLVIKPHRPRQRLLIGLLLVTVLVGAVSFAFHYGHWQSIGRSMGAASGKQGLMDELVGLRRKNKVLVEKNARLVRSVEIDRHARDDYQKTVSTLQTEIADLKLELAFYRDVIASTEADKGPLVRGFKLRDYGGTGRYMYRLVLTHVNKDDKVASGHVDVEIRGRASSGEKRLALADVSEQSSGDLDFNFKHFRRIEGVLQLPDDFAPEEVRIAVYEEGRKKSSFNKTYNWAKIIN